jgi:hypothetical protein
MHLRQADRDDTQRLITQVIHKLPPARDDQRE